MEHEIFVKKTQDRKAFVKGIMKKYSSEIKTKRKIFVKPNIVSHESYPTTTHPDVLRSVLEYLIKTKSEIIVGDGTAVDSGNSDNIIKNHPLAKVCKEFKLELLNLHKKGFDKLSYDSVSLRVSKVPLDCDYIISLPVLKSHPMCTITGAVKNQFGFLQNRERIMLHSGIKNLHKGIAALNMMVKPDLFIVDFVETLIGANERRHGGKEKKAGYMLAGKYAISLDMKGLELFMEIDPKLKEIRPDDIKHIRYYADMV